MARPTKFKSEFAAQAEKLCKLGATDKELADFFEVSERALNDWKSAHPEFLQSIKSGKDLADAEVADKLFKRATGYSHPDVDIRAIEGEIVQTPLIKHYPPDTAAAIFWLKNRQKEKWRDKVDHGLGGLDGKPLAVPIFNVTFGEQEDGATD
ncbi:helix-turn-helix domain-containing protein [Chitiniphilus shinanonensis]|uniref:helix-turn-helix domain-containing protein n=1 Tax=Chitiniphilus shinanonensis TaxID=553088 RepID=UPI003048B5F1